MRIGQYRLVGNGWEVSQTGRERYSPEANSSRRSLAPIDILKSEPPLRHSSPALSTEIGFLRAEFLTCLQSLAGAVLARRDAKDRLRTVVTHSFFRGVAPRTLVRWAVANGYSESHIRNVISKILRDAGLHRRNLGGGRRVPQEALAILAFCRQKFGVRATKYLAAAARAAKAENATQGRIIETPAALAANESAAAAAPVPYTVTV